MCDSTPIIEYGNEKNEEIDVMDLIDDLIKKPPYDEKSVLIQFQNHIDVKDLFEILLMMFTNICKIYFSNDGGIVNLDILSNDDLNFVQKYFQSIGFIFAVETHNYNTMTPAEISNLDHSKYSNIEITKDTKIEDLYFILKCQNIIYKITFYYV